MADVLAAMLDRNEVPSVVGLSRAAGVSLSESRGHLEDALAAEPVVALYVAVETTTDPSTKAILGKTISLSRMAANASLYAIHATAKAESPNIVDDGIKTALWFPTIADGLPSASFGSATSSDVHCAAATERQGKAKKGAESASVFQHFEKPTISTTPTFAKSSKPKPAAKSGFFATSKPAPAKKKMTHVIDSDDESDNSDDEMPKFVKATNKRLKVCDSDDDDDDDDPLPKTTSTPKPPTPKAPTSKPPTPKAPTPKAATPKAATPKAPTPKRSPEPPTAPPAKRQRLVTKTRIDEHGYMVNESVYEDVESGDEEPAPPVAPKPRVSAKLPAPPPKKKRVLKTSGTAKQSNLMDFFGKK
ncbi:hypothetical protein SPRG_04041 [Saprolegnia parasitica CBS 223.65]|uniref:DNA polymerase delta subunit 3 n=1 Tax=Saprolegnia parasitica (strain CBS 223.65) TaxID=695850 RepID=A0A067CY16_SAPPC|nr:hypothetical protein SPRG_04041 [Saprolegnia parasitica CBS 223.65]KDO31426.1 hypothetical protein SPRG_04041 [Saprolegnia parasitica CBS 223.65]|eukprot:XP_012198021.1 hypothetical protein SPRG_04041 [Saprolegnia parasitica CBS 223.65]